ncbi:LacI family DNA-binding transcriptional regulator [Dictyobacter aurantiacus]|uniref:LacI family transcriptional regulator n=1 Tax=Dictyobacter aurantiacus TaxID=1936993 RepID=A0A401ZRH7_9CHLR|nr:LacI family DNA-binding transcriptional regulator [Dictyobacter aurantiacus]GCE09406.1 LacI family transcriptional regulator [Dictyobacter aurantiacus]
MRIKLRDIAERAHVSLSTVSRVINNHPTVDAKTREEVMAVLKEFGYPLNFASLGQNSATNHAITVAVSGVQILQDTPYRQGNEDNRQFSSFGPVVCNGIELVCQRSNTLMTIQRIRLEAPTPEDLALLAQAKGVIIVGGMVAASVIDTLEEANVPFVLVGAHLGIRMVNCVQGDYLSGFVEAMKVLVQNDHHQIAFVNGPVTTTTSQDKLSGYQLGLCQSGDCYHEQLVISAEDFTPHDGYQATQKLLARKAEADFSAIIYASDLLALGGLYALQEAGIAVPEQLSIMGCYDEPIAQFTTPPLSTIHLDWQRMGEIAAQRLLALLTHQNEYALRIVVPMRLIMRASHARKAI